jgi:hypothetical protein
MRPSLHRPLVLCAAAIALACGGDARPSADVPSAGVVDSTLPIAELLNRFQATLADSPRTLVGGAESPEALTRALFAAVAASDTSALRALIVSRAEFGFLYYPHSQFTRAPYELAPDLVWLTMVAASEKGAGRLLTRYGGRTLRFEALLCGDTAQTEGPNLIRRGCRVRFAVPDSGVREVQLFGALLARDGRTKFLSFANDL